MPNVKTAISIEKPIFEQMNVLAKTWKVSRSRLFSIAAREFIERHENANLLKHINDAYVDVPDSEPIVSKMRPKHFNIIKDQW